MSYQPILQVAARNYARDIIQGEPVNVMLRPINGQFGYVFNYPTYGRPRIGIVYAPGVDAEAFYASKTYGWVGVRVNGKQYGWVSMNDFMLEEAPTEVASPNEADPTETPPEEVLSTRKSGRPKKNQE